MKVVTSNEASQKNIEGPSSRVKVIVSKRNADGEPVESPGELQQKDKDEDKDVYAFVLKRINYDKSTSYTDRSEIDVKNPKLWDLLKKHLRPYPDHIFSESPVTLYSPYEFIVFHWDRLQQVVNEDGGGDNNDDRQARVDLKLLLDTIEGSSSGDKELVRYFQARPTYKKQENETIQFKDLWTIFAPGTLIYGKPFQNEDQVFLVKDNRGTWPMRDDRTRENFPFELDVWSYDWKNDSFGRSTFVIKIPNFEGHRPLIALEYFPFELHAQYITIRETLIQRGKKFRKFCNGIKGMRMFDYKGNAIPEKKGFSGMKGEDVCCVPG